MHPPMDAIHITDIEAAINFWRERKPSPDGITLAPEIRALAEVYALMVYHHEDEVAEKGFPSQAMAELGLGVCTLNTSDAAREK